MSENTGLSIAGSKEISERAAWWLVRQHASSGWSADDQAAFESWMAQSPAHLMAYWRLEAVWDRADRLSALRETSREAKQPSNARRIRSFIAFGAVGLCLLGVVTAGALSYFHTEQAVAYETAIGGHKILTLADGSKIELNTDTRIRLAADGARRKVWLDRGEAYFQIRHDAAHPFVVVAGTRQVIDVGTAFSVRRDTGRLQVALTEGRARLESIEGGTGAKSIMLVPGDVAVATRDGVALVTRPIPELTDQLAWRRGLLAFDSTPLAEVAAEFNRYNRQKLVVVGADARNVEVGGHFRATNVDAFKRIARTILKLRVETHGDETVISQ
jgi:transmembrane sensor